MVFEKQIYTEALEVLVRQYELVPPCNWNIVKQ